MFTLLMLIAVITTAQGICFYVYFINIVPSSFICSVLSLNENLVALSQSSSISAFLCILLSSFQK